MADRYWVGGAGTWDATDTTHWSASSGGGAGASAPTSVDNVFFDTASNATAYAVTIGLTAVAANAADISIAGPLVGNVTITSAATSVINCYGSWLNAATGVAFSSTSGAAVNFLAAATGQTITANGVAFGVVTTTLNNAGGGWTLGSAFTTTSTFFVTAGSFSTSASNYSLTCGSLTSLGTLVRSVNLNASTVSLSGSTVVNLAATNLTFSAGTSSITVTSTAPIFNGGGQTFYNVSYTSLSQASASITGANTFNNLTFPVKTLVSVANITIAADQVVTGTLTMAGNTYNTRFLLLSSVIGTPRTITAGAVSLAYVDFRDIVGAGTATWTGTSIGNCLGNTNITFDAPKTVYWNLAGAQVWTATAWALSSGGTPAAANFPLAQDTAVFDNAGAAGTINSWAANVGTVDVSLRTTTVTFVATTTISVYGNWINGTGTVLSGAGTINFLGRSLQTITPAGITFGSGITVTAFGGTVRLEDTLISTGTLTLTNGTLDLNGYTITTGLFSSTNSNVRTFAFGTTGKCVLTATTGTVLSMSTATNFTYTGTSRIEVTASGAGRTITPPATGAVESNALNIYVTTGTDTVTVGGAARFLNFDLTGFAGTLTYASSSRYFGDLVFSSGMTLGSITGSFTFAKTSGTQTITSAGQTIDQAVNISATGATVAMQDALTLGSTRALTMTDGTLQLKAGTTNTVGSFVTTGTTLKYLQSTIPGTQATISDASGTNTVTYLSIQDSNATGGAEWYANGTTNLNVGNNTGWIFTVPDVDYGTGNGGTCFGFGFKI